VNAVLVAIALLWLSSAVVWPLAVALLACSMVWADGGSEVEVVAFGLISWFGLLTLRRKWRRRRLR
jgi:ABC-type nickel/cobalt efflux system permease component RcnA